MIEFIRLTRPLNMIIVALTMYGLGWYLDDLAATSKFGIRTFDFFLLVLSTTLIAAAGNIINDYFDVRADRVNKPERLIIGKTVKRRVAILTHWALNIVAFSIAAYLSWRLETFWYVFIHLLSINLLWYYSSYFKRKFFIGNIVIAGLTALVPMLVGFYYSHSLSIYPEHINPYLPQVKEALGQQINILTLSLALAGFAFVLNLAREIVKDMEDIPGDQILQAKTIPIVVGLKGAKWIVATILITSGFMSFLFVMLFPHIEITTFLPLFIAEAFVIVAIITTFLSKEKKDYKRTNMWIKLAMVAGLLTPVYWKLILYYG